MAWQLRGEITAVSFLGRFDASSFSCRMSKLEDEVARGRVADRRGTGTTGE